MEKDKIKQKIDLEMLTLSNTKKMLKGTINKVAVKNKRAGEKDSVIHQLTYKGEKNKTKTMYIRAERLKTAKEMVENYQKTKKALNKILELNIELFKLESKQ